MRCEVRLLTGVQVGLFVYSFPPQSHQGLLVMCPTSEQASLPPSLPGLELIADSGFSEAIQAKRSQQECVRG